VAVWSWRGWELKLCSQGASPRGSAADIKGGAHTDQAGEERACQEPYQQHTPETIGTITSQTEMKT